MSEIPPTSTRPPAFAAAVESVHRAAARDALAVTEIPAPNGLAPHALALAGDAAATDPVCHLSPLHVRVGALAATEAGSGAGAYHYRGYGPETPA